MKREILTAIAAVALSALFATSDADAQMPGRGDAPSGAMPGPVDPNAKLPPGHPAIPDEGSPLGAAPAAPDGDGHQHADGEPPHGGGGMPGLRQPDGAFPDPSLPSGTVEIRLVDASGKPLGKTEVSLTISHNSVSKGDSHRRVMAMSDETGAARFDDLEIGSGVSYKPQVTKDGGTFSVMPFQLMPRGGMRAQLHVFPVTRSIEQAFIASQVITFAEVKDDRVQVQQAYTLVNFGNSAWVPPNDYIIPLPETFTAFATQPGMTDISVDSVAKRGVRLVGTFAPGQHVVEFKWQLPYSGDGEVTFDIGMTPHLGAARVIAPAAKGMGMIVEGFQPPQLSSDGAQRVLITEKQFRREDKPLKSLKVTINGLPTEGPGKIIATLLTLGGIGLGLVLGVRKPPPRDTKREREQLLGALKGLEQAHRKGTIGPKTYERARREIIDDLARTFAAEPEPVRAVRAKRVAAVS